MTSACVGAPTDYLSIFFVLVPPQLSFYSLLLSDTLCSHGSCCTIYQYIISLLNPGGFPILLKNYCRPRYVVHTTTPPLSTLLPSWSPSPYRTFYFRTSGPLYMQQVPILWYLFLLFLFWFSFLKIGLAILWLPAFLLPLPPTCGDDSHEAHDRLFSPVLLLFLRQGLL